MSSSRPARVAARRVLERRRELPVDDPVARRLVRMARVRTPARRGPLPASPRPHEQPVEGAGRARPHPHRARSRRPRGDRADPAVGDGHARGPQQRGGQAGPEAPAPQRIHDGEPATARVREQLGAARPDPDGRRARAGVAPPAPSQQESVAEQVGEPRGLVRVADDPPEALQRRLRVPEAEIEPQPVPQQPRLSRSAGGAGEPGALAIGVDDAGVRVERLGRVIRHLLGCWW